MGHKLNPHDHEMLAVRRDRRIRERRDRAFEAQFRRNATVLHAVERPLEIVQTGADLDTARQMVAAFRGKTEPWKRLKGKMDEGHRTPTPYVTNHGGELRIQPHGIDQLEQRVP